MKACPHIKIYQSKHSALIQSGYKASFLIAEIREISSSFLWTKYIGILWGDDIINSLICKFISTVQEMFRWKLQKFKISYLPYVLSNFHQNFTALFNFFYSFYWLNLNLDRISPLKLLHHHLSLKYKDYVQSSLVPNTWANQVNEKFTLVKKKKRSW